MAPLLCSFSFFLLVVHLPGSRCDQSSSSECSPQALEEPGVAKLAHEDSVSQFSLLQTSLHLGRGTSEAGAKDVDDDLMLALQTVERLSAKGKDSGGKATLSRHNYEAIAEVSSTSLSTGAIVLIVLVGCLGLGLGTYMLIGGRAPPPEAPPKGLVQKELAQLSDVGTRFKQGLPSLSCCGSSQEQVKGEFDSPSGGSEEEVEDIAISPPVELDADTFGMSVCSLCRDSYFMTREGPSFARILRIISSLGLVFFTIFIQVYLLAKVKQFVSARAVHDIREAYDAYEVAIYGNHTYITVNGYHRGYTEYFPTIEVAMQRLDGMDEDDRDDACRIPLSQPDFFGVILLIWTLTCCAELRRAFTLQLQITHLHTVGSMAESLRQGDDDDSGSDGVIHGMTIPMKIIITLTMFIPRVSITLYLLYLGCRWLLATNDFADLVMNAIALEFILLIKECLYVALMPARSHLDLSLTLIEPYPKVLRPAWYNFVNSFFILVIAIAWVYLYMYHFQAVLPDYNWDVHEVCVEYIKERFAV